MTKTIVFHENCLAEQPKKKPIEFRKRLNSMTAWEDTNLTPSHFKTVVLISKNYSWTDPANSLVIKFDDVMIAYDEIPLNNTIFLGSWNDGVS